MKKILLTLLSAVALCVCACDKYDDTPLRNELSGLESRVANLEDLCSKLNTNIASIQTLLNNINAKIAIERVVSLDNGEGYLITFSNGSSITVYNGVDGSEGPKGNKGDKGDKGDKGEPGEAPVIGVGSEEGVLYWTLNGEWLFDDEGNKIPVVGPKGDKGDQGEPGKNGSNGSNGSNGQNGSNGVTPQLKIEDGKWMVSYDNGSSWKEVATSGDNPYNTMALTIEETEDAFIITLDGESYTISKAAEAAVSFQIKVDSDDVAISGQSVTVSYTLTGGDETTHVFSEGTLPSVVDESACTVTIYGDKDTEGYVILRAIRNSDGANSAQYIGVSGSVFTILTAQEVTVDGDGGTFEVQVKTNLEYSVTLPDWITEEPDTKAVRTDTKTFKAAANTTGAERSATIIFKTSDGSLEQAVVVTQPEATATGGDGSLENPFTPAEAAAATADLTWTSNTEYDKIGPYYVKGKISRIANKGTFTEGGTYGNASFFISEDGTETNEFQCYRILYLENKKFQSGQTDIKVGDEVVVYGELMNYKGNTPETVSGKAYLYSLNGATSDEGSGDQPGGDDTPTGDGISFATNSDAQTWAAATDGTYGSGFGTTVQGVSVAYYKHTSTTNPVAPNANHIRVYKNSALVVIAPSGKTIKSIVLTTEPDSGSNSYCSDMAGLEGGASAVADKSALTVSWSGSASKVVLHATNTQIRVKNIAIEFE